MISNWKRVLPALHTGLLASSLSSLPRDTNDIDFSSSPLLLLLLSQHAARVELRWVTPRHKSIALTHAR